MLQHVLPFLRVHNVKNQRVPLIEELLPDFAKEVIAMQMAFNCNSEGMCSISKNQNNLRKQLLRGKKQCSTLFGRTVGGKCQRMQPNVLLSKKAVANGEPTPLGGVEKELNKNI